MLNPYTLKKVQFEQWLTAQPQNSIVGVKKRCFLCPLARFLREHYGVYRAEVSVNYYYVEADRYPYKPAKRYQIPSWANRFVLRVDSLDDDYVSAETALKLLRNKST